MNNLLIPAAGTSSRFPNMKLKWLLTHPTGDLVIEKVLQPFDLKAYDRVIVTVLR
jgi:CTP:molybdopterin cytidylyltransferase MocA